MDYSPWSKMEICLFLKIAISHAHSHFLFSLKVERRENEIEHLAGQLRGGRPPEALLAMKGKIETNERMTAHIVS